MVCGPRENLIALCFYNGNHKESDIEDLFNQLKKDDQLIVCTDIQYGSVNQNFVKTAMNRNLSNVMIISGINLPILLEIVLRPDELTFEDLNDIVEKSKNQISNIDWHLKPNSATEDNLF